MEKYQLERIACPLCNSRGYQKYISAHDRLNISEEKFDFVKCSTCGLVYQNPRIMISTIHMFYPNNYFSIRPGRNKRSKKIATKIALLKCDIINNIQNKPGKLLEIGSANGDFLAEMRNRGWFVKGVEISSDASDFARREFGLDIFTGSLNEMPDDGIRYDLIVMWAVLPHIHNPLEVMKDVSKLLCDNGSVIVCCANIDSYAAEKMKEKWGHLDLPRHYCLWSPTTLYKLFDSVGLKFKELIFDDKIFNSNLVLPFLYPLINIGRPPFVGAQGIVCRIIRKISIELNYWLTKKTLKNARDNKQGGIMIAWGSKNSRL